MTSQESYPELYTLRFYIKQSVKALIRRPGAEMLADLIRDFGKWKSQGYENLFGNPKPWMAAGAVRFIESIRSKNGIVFEYGSGASTVFMATRFEKVVSTEHEEGWHSVLKSQLAEKGLLNVEYVFQGPETRTESGTLIPENPDHYHSVFEGYDPVTFRNYASEIDRFPDEYFDLIIVDGRVRPSCLKHSWPKLKKGGYMVLDNSDRPHYQKMANEITKKSASKISFYGPVAQNPMFQETTFWKK
jgi:predicted O-methyltransferase YrrM